MVEIDMVEPLRDGWERNRAIGIARKLVAYLLRLHLVRSAKIVDLRVPGVDPKMDGVLDGTA
jgi:hypothetical protein